mgnify:FL=1
MEINMGKTEKKRFSIKFLTQGKENQSTIVTNGKNKYTSVSYFLHKMETTEARKSTRDEKSVANDPYKTRPSLRTEKQ